MAVQPGGTSFSALMEVLKTLLQQLLNTVHLGSDSLRD